MNGWREVKAVQFVARWWSSMKQHNLDWKDWKDCVVEEASKTRRWEKPKVGHCEYRSLRGLLSIVTYQKKRGLLSIVNLKKNYSHIHCCEYVLFEMFFIFPPFLNEKRACNFSWNMSIISSKIVLYSLVNVLRRSIWTAAAVYSFCFLSNYCI